MILTEIGEIGVHHNGETYILRPSLYAMTQIGNPTEVLKTYAIVMTDFKDMKSKWHQFQEALIVINSCCEADLSEVFGYLNNDRKFVKKHASFSDVITIARSLLKHGITGVQEPLKSKEPDQSTFIKEFKASDHVSLVMAHLGVHEKDAWNMTMTSIIGAMRAKFPEPESKEPGSRAPTKEQHDATMEWFERVQRKRGQKVH